MTTTSTTPRHTYTSLLPLLLPPTTPSPLLPPPSPPHNQKPRATHAHLTSAIAALQLHPTLETLLHTLNSDLSSAHFLVRHMQSPPAWEGMLLHALLHRYEGHISNARAWYTDIAGCALLEFVWASSEEERQGVQEAQTRDAEAVKRGAREAVERDERRKRETGRTGKEEEGKHSAQNNADEGDASAPGTKAAQEASTGLPRVLGFLERVEKVQEVVNAPHRFEGGVEAFEREMKELHELSEVECRRLLAWCEVKFGTEKWEDARDEYVGMSEKIAEMATKQVMGGEGWRQF